MSGIFNSFDLREFAQHQPGEVLLRHLVEVCCQRGYSDFDLGVGEAQYKDSWCPRTDRLFDSFLPLSAAGWMHTSVAMTGFRLKRAAKQSKFLRDLTDRLR
jgi:CelD/BcsL family acetyltransferase involved in cellulose biosynthesis